MLAVSSLSASDAVENEEGEHLVPAGLAAAIASSELFRLETAVVIKVGQHRTIQAAIGAGTAEDADPRIAEGISLWRSRRAEQLAVVITLKKKAEEAEIRRSIWLFPGVWHAGLEALLSFPPGNLHGHGLFPLVALDAAGRIDGENVTAYLEMSGGVIILRYSRVLAVSAWAAGCRILVIAPHDR